MKTKICKFCGNEFEFKRSNKVYCSNVCSRYYNKERNKQYNKQWRENNKERIKEYSDQWYKDNKERIKEYSNQRYKDIKERNKQYSKQWRENNKKYIKQWRVKRRKQLGDDYIITQLIKQTNITRDQITPELIELKRKRIELHRYKNQIKEQLKTLAT